MPTPEQRRPVLSIDLGASYTKVAWRPEWTDGVSEFSERTAAIVIDEGELIPSLAYDPRDGRQWLFGMKAARVRPGASGELHKDWKSVLYDQHATQEEIESAMGVAVRFFEWLKAAIEEKGYKLANAKVRLCVPAFLTAKFAARRIADSMNRAGWVGDTLFVTEPVANVIGVASEGRNWAACRNGFVSVSPERMYRIDGARVPELISVHNVPWSRRLCVIDIGAFTTDFAVADVRRGKVSNETQQSIRHGISKLDEEFAELLRTRGLDPDAASQVEFNLLKQRAYQLQAFSYQNVAIEESCMRDAIEEFARGVVEVGAEYWTEADWLSVTGGGSAIPSLTQALWNAVREQRPNMWAFVQQATVDRRIATALGACSLMLDFDVADDDAGENEEDSDGDDVNEAERGRAGTLDEIEREEVDGKGNEGEVESDKDTEEENERSPEGDIEPEIGDAEVEVRGNEDESEGEQVSKADEDQEEEVPRRTRAPLDFNDLVECWEGSEERAIREFCLEGWMGDLVFEGMPSRLARLSCLAEATSDSGKAAWLKLLCLCSSLGVRGKPRFVEGFWRGRLAPVWQVLIGQEDGRLLDRYFEEAIHKQFSDRQSKGEDADLLRRVFYDFRKLHHFVYHNDLPGVFMELLDQQNLPFDALVNFLKSGWTPDGQRWAGVLGQSMTAPVLLLVRMLRRLGVIRHSRFDAACFYMNGPARRVARRLGWITEGERAWFDIESLVELSRKCHDRMRVEASQLPEYFDIPLQWYALQHPQEIRLA